MAFDLGYCTIRWKNPDLEPALEALKAAGWDGWEGRLSLDWMGRPNGSGAYAQIPGCL